MKTNYISSELYLPLAQRVLGDMYDYACNTLNYSLNEFHKMFIVCGMAHQFEIYNATYVAGKNGCEIAKLVIEWCGLETPETEDIMYVDKSPEYWVGWALAYYQWKSGLPYKRIDENAPIDFILNIYDKIHETDISVFVEIMDKKCSDSTTVSRLKRLRMYAEISQRELSEKSGVPLRQIQLFEQGQRDINKTGVDNLKKLADALWCEMGELVEIMKENK